MSSLLTRAWRSPPLEDVGFKHGTSIYHASRFPSSEHPLPRPYATVPTGLLPGRDCFRLYPANISRPISAWTIGQAHASISTCTLTISTTELSAPPNTTAVCVINCIICSLVDRKTPGIEDLPRSYRGIIKGLSGHQVKPHRPNFPFGPWIC